MDQAVVPTSEVIDRIVEMLRRRLERARANGQSVRINARETRRTVMGARLFDSQYREPLLDVQSTSSGYELHLYIDPKS